MNLSRTPCPPSPRPDDFLQSKDGRNHRAARGDAERKLAHIFVAQPQLDVVLELVRPILGAPLLHLCSRKLLVQLLFFVHLVFGHLLTALTLDAAVHDDLRFEFLLGLTFDAFL